MQPALLNRLPLPNLLAAGLRPLWETLVYSELLRRRLACCRRCCSRGGEVATARKPGRRDHVSPAGKAPTRSFADPIVCYLIVASMQGRKIEGAASGSGSHASKPQY